MNYIVTAQLFLVNFLNQYRHLSLLLLTLPLLLAGSGHDSLMPHDEGYYGLQARWILETKNWLAPQFWGTPIYDRTIGLQWLIAISYQLFGISEFSSRLPSLISCIICVLLTYEIGKIIINKQVGWLAAVILLLMAKWISESRIVQQNITLVAIELLGIYALLKAEEVSKRYPKNRIYWAIIAGTTVGLGFLIKGFMVALPVVAIMPYLFLNNNRHRHLFNPGLYTGLIIGSIPVILWLTLSCLKYGILPLQDLVGKLLFLSSTDTWNPGPLYYFWNIPANSFPWVLFSILGTIFIWKKANLRNNQRLILLIGYPVILFILLSCFRTRSHYYPVQMLPFLAILVAVFFENLEDIAKSYYWHLRQIISFIFYFFTSLGLLLFIAGILAISQRNLFGLNITSEIKMYGFAAIILGLGWSTINFTWKNRNNLPQKLWLNSWLISPWLAILIIGFMGGWTDKIPEFKKSIHQPNILSVITSHPINFVLEAPRDTKNINQNILNNNYDENLSKQLISLTYYTPKLGQKIPLNQLAKNNYAWISPQVKRFLTTGNKNQAKNQNKIPINNQYNSQYKIFGSVEGWDLVKKK